MVSTTARRRCPTSSGFTTRSNHPIKSVLQPVCGLESEAGSNQILKALCQTQAMGLIYTIDTLGAVYGWGRNG